MDTAADHLPDPHTAADLQKIFEVLREQLTALSSVGNHVPSRLRVSAGEAAILIEWPPQSAAVASAGVSAMQPSPPRAQSAPAVVSAGHGICAQLVGVFYRAKEPGAAPFVSEGDIVVPGQQVGIIEAMKLMTPVEADRAGRVTKILVADGAAVEHGQPLIAVDPVS